MTLPYHACYVRLRQHMVAGFGYLAAWRTFGRLVGFAQGVPCEAFLVDAGDDLTEKAHRHAKLSQHVDEYAPERLRTPRFTHADEQGDLAAPLSAGSFLELVMAGGEALEKWYLANRDLMRAQGDTSSHRDPLEIHCHTPLNQRLLPAHLRVCQWLVESLAYARDAVPNHTPPPVVASVCIIGLAKALGLEREALGSLFMFGADYLSQYLDVPDCTARREAATRRRADRIDALVGIFASGTLPETLTRPLRGNDFDVANGFFFPESLWMQCHWFVASLGVSLAQELALTFALREWARKEVSRGLRAGYRR